jgi:hypothetical protein
MLGFEAQSVIALRLMKLGAGGANANKEASRMIQEKITAFHEAQRTVATALFAGKGAGAAHKVVSGYRKKVRANHKRLSGGG